MQQGYRLKWLPYMRNTRHTTQRTFGAASTKSRVFSSIS